MGAMRALGRSTIPKKGMVIEMEGILIPVILLAVIGLVAGIMLALAAKFMPTPTNEQLEAVKEALPGVNCGACGFAGCSEYAEKVAQGAAKTNLCVPGGAAVSHSLSQIMGTAYEETEEKYGSWSAAPAAVTRWSCLWSTRAS